LTKNYLQENEVLIRKEIVPFLPEIDTIIFDIDGVLVDVSSSYYQTIIDTVQYYFSNIINIPGEEKLVDGKAIAGFKMIGGFNNDWELSAAAVLYYLWKMEEYQLKSMERLKDSPPLIHDFVNKNLSNGGGLSQLMTWIKKNASDPEKIFSLWNKEKIFQLAKEFYAGERNCYRLYHFYPEIVHQVTGNMEKEIISIIPEVTELLKRYQVGILTGRNRTETHFFMEQINWYSWLDPGKIVTSEDHMTKPSPDGLKFLMEYFQSKKGLYIGDTMDDLLTVKNLNHQYGKQYCLSALVLGNNFTGRNDYKEHYLKKEVDLLAENVNQVVQLIHHRIQ